MLSDEQTNEILSLIGTTNPDPGREWDLRVASTKLSIMRTSSLWPEPVRKELDGIDGDFGRYVAATELSRFGLGAPPKDEDFLALVSRIRGLVRFVAGAELEVDETAR